MAELFPGGDYYSAETRTLGEYTENESSV